MNRPTGATTAQAFANGISTFIPTAAGFLHLAVVLDAWTRSTVGWSMARACESLSSGRLLDPVHGGGHAEHAHEAAGRLLVACRDCTPLLEPGPEPIDGVAVH